MRSELPWRGRAEVELDLPVPTELTLRLRIPSWTESPVVRLGDETIPVPPPPAPATATASSYDPFRSRYLILSRRFEGRATLSLELPMPIERRHAHEKVRTDRGRVAVSRGPLVYCAESWDNREAEVPEATLDPEATIEVAAPPASAEALGLPEVLAARHGDRPLVLIPYYAWANRGASAMQVWLREGSAAAAPPADPEAA